jgi:hypothetical protein
MFDNAFTTMSETLQIFASLSVFDSIQSLSQVCSMYRMEMSFSFVTVMDGINKWGLYFSKFKRNGSSTPDISHTIKCFR